MWQPIVGLTIFFIAVSIVVGEILKQFRHPERYETPPFLRFMKRSKDKKKGII